MAIATVPELTLFMRRTLDDASAQLVLDLAEGLVIGEIGEQPSYSVVAKAVVLSVANRLYSNPSGYQSETAGGRSYSGAVGGLVLLPDELDRLRRGIPGNGSAFTITPAYPARTLDGEYPYR